MAEMLVVMAIIMVLSGIAVPSGTRLLKNVRQMSLNRSAETIYMTAQRNLIAAKLANNKLLEPNSVDLPYYKKLTGGKDTDGVHNVSGMDKKLVLPANTISPTLYGGNWIIEYDSAYLVRKVYFSENTPLENLETVYNTSGKLGEVGYYGE